MTDEMRTFDTGATRNSEEGKLDYEGFLSPLVLRRYAEYMNANRVQADGELRDSDNWQKGIPLNAYMKSMWRHFMGLWFIHRGYAGGGKGTQTEQEEMLCAVIFNASGYLHEILVSEYQLGVPGDICIGNPSVSKVRPAGDPNSEPHSPAPDYSNAFVGEDFKE